MKAFVSAVCRLFFVASFVLAVLAIFEKLANMTGYTLIRDLVTPWRLLELSAVALLFVIALQLREIKDASRSGGGV
jgi:hypothetical protein